MMRNVLIVVAILLGCGMVSVVGHEKEERTMPPLNRRQSHDAPVVDTRENQKLSWREAISNRIVGEGIAWRDAKGIGNRVILDCTTIFVESLDDFAQPGRLIEVSGILVLRHVDPKEPSAQGGGPAYDYYAISDAKWRYIDVAKMPKLAIPR